MQEKNWQDLLQDSLQEEPKEWFCNVVQGGNGLSAQPFKVPGINGQLLSIPYKNSSAGGDVHYVTVCNLGTYSKFLIIDVSGHGEKAGELSTKLYDVLWKLIDQGDNKKVLGELNNIMVKMGALGKFATVLLATYNSWFRSWTFTYAGHHSMLLFRNGQWQPLQLSSDNKSIPIGIVGDTEFRQETIWLDFDDRLLLFSDLVIEVRNQKGQQLGEDGVTKWLNEHAQTTPTQQFKGLCSYLADINGGQEFDDDFTCMLLHHTPKKWTWWSRQLCRFPPFDKWCWKF